ncbi:hypothetical protein J1614_011156 [Plenodomus biglobosus]|nr:hypothetical protein J1614_011156 [Plenodomus biglobosus]
MLEQRQAGQRRRCTNGSRQMHPTSSIRSKEQSWLACAVDSPITALLAALASDVASSHWQGNSCLMGWTELRQSSPIAPRLSILQSQQAMENQNDDSRRCASGQCPAAPMCPVRRVDERLAAVRSGHADAQRCWTTWTLRARAWPASAVQGYPIHQYHTHMQHG